MRTNNQKGSVALTTVIVISAILLFSGISILITNIDLTRVANDYNNRLVVTLGIESCFEESLYKLKYDRTYTGTINLSNGFGDCSSLIEDDGVDIKKFTLTSNLDEYYYEVTRRVDISVFPFVRLD